MQLRSVVTGIGILLAASTIASAQVDSNVGVSAYAQSRGTPCKACSGDLTKSCSSDADCVSKGTCINSRGATGCGGCYPARIPAGDPTSELPKVDPEWSPIGPMIQVGGDPSVPPFSQPVQMSGTVALTKINVGGDFPGSHVSDDQNTFINLDDSSHLSTGNSGAITSCPGEGCNLLEMEREIGKYPLFAWAGEGDRITTLGRWIFDCGHPDPTPGQCSNDNSPCIADSDCGDGNTCVGGVGGCTGSGARCIVDADCTSGQTCTNPTPDFHFRAEMHPPLALAVMRNKSIGKIPATQADVYISADGGGAGDICTVTHLENPNDGLFVKTCFSNTCRDSTGAKTGRSCSANSDCAGGQTCAVFDPAKSGPVLDVNGSDFTFDMVLPAAPSDTSVLKIKTASFKPKGGLMPKPQFVLPTPPYGANPVLHVTIPMSQSLPSGKMPNVFAGRISAGWKQDPTALQHVKIKFQSLTINNPLKARTFAFPRQCTNTNGSRLSGKACTTDAECEAGACANANPTKACHSDKDCSKTDFCLSPSRCVGGLFPGWKMWGQTNGDWIQFKKLDTVGAKAPFTAPPYTIPPTPAVLPEHFTFDEFVPAGSTIHVATTGSSLNCLDTLYGHNLKEDLGLYGLTTGGACLSAGDPDPGRIEVTHSGTNFATASGANCTTSGTLMTCTATSTGGDGGTCSITTSKLCTTDADCPGMCSGSPTGACATDTDCKHCSVTTSQFCSSNFECPVHGTCSDNANQFCHVDGDCGLNGTCNGTPETCVANGGATCIGAETCDVSGGAFTLTYTLQVK